jgi:hypothetical protein
MPHTPSTSKRLAHLPARRVRSASARKCNHQDSRRAFRRHSGTVRLRQDRPHGGVKGGVPIFLFENVSRYGLSDLVWGTETEALCAAQLAELKARQRRDSASNAEPRWRSAARSAAHWQDPARGSASHAGNPWERRRLPRLKHHPSRRRRPRSRRSKSRPPHKLSNLQAI